MSITIRLAKFGKRHQPTYRVVVANTRDKRNGKFLDNLGHYNPHHEPALFEYDEVRYKDWLGKGALVTDAVKKLIEGTYEFKAYDPNAKDEPEEKVEEAEEPTEEEPTDQS